MYSYKNPDATHYIAYEDLYNDSTIAKAIFKMASRTNKNDLTVEEKTLVRQWLNIKSESGISKIDTIESNDYTTITFSLSDNTTKQVKIKKTSPGVASVKTTQSYGDGGKNTITFYNSEGVVLQSVSIFNGSAGLKGDKGDKGSVDEEQLKSINDQVSAALSMSKEAISASNEAKSYALEATNAASAAQEEAIIAASAASSSESKANVAQEMADMAQATATTAQILANNAQTTADNAYAAADKAQNSANNAQISADEAKQLANQATSIEAKDVKNLQSQIDALNTTTSNLQTQIDSTEAIANIASNNASEALEKLKGLTVNADGIILESTNANLSTTTNVLAALEKIANKVWYEKIAITSFTSSWSSGLFEIGTTIMPPVFTWKTSKVPAKVVIAGTTLSNPTITTYSYPNSITSATSVTLVVTESDEQAGTASKSISWFFGHGIYTGMATMPDSFTQDWIKNTLGGKSIKTSAKGTYTMKGSTTSQYWWLVAPSLWNISFKTALGSGGAEKVGIVDAFVNDQGATVPMTIYRASKVQGSDMAIEVI